MSDASGNNPMFEQPDFGAASESEEYEDLEDGDSYTGEGDADVDIDDEEDEEDEAAAGQDDPNRRSAVGSSAARAVLEHVTASLVEDPSAIVIEEGAGRSGVRYSVHVAAGDMGRVIGRRGRTVQALRTLVRAAAASEGRDAQVEVVD